MASLGGEQHRHLKGTKAVTNEHDPVAPQNEGDDHDEWNLRRPGEREKDPRYVFHTTVGRNGQNLRVKVTDETKRFIDKVVQQRRIPPIETAQDLVRDAIAVWMEHRAEQGWFEDDPELAGYLNEARITAQTLEEKRRMDDRLAALAAIEERANQCIVYDEWEELPELISRLDRLVFTAIGAVRQAAIDMRDEIADAHEYRRYDRIRVADELIRRDMKAAITRVRQSQHVSRRDADNDD